MNQVETIIGYIVFGFVALIAIITFILATGWLIWAIWDAYNAAKKGESMHPFGCPSVDKIHYNYKRCGPGPG